MSIIFRILIVRVRSPAILTGSTFWRIAIPLYITLTHLFFVRCLQVSGIARKKFIRRTQGWDINCLPDILLLMFDFIVVCKYVTILI